MESIEIGLKKTGMILNDLEEMLFFEVILVFVEVG